MVIKLRELPYLALLPIVGAIADCVSDGVTKQIWSGWILLYGFLGAIPLWLMLKGVQFILVKANTPMDQK
jgi:hypothetical protein